MSESNILFVDVIVVPDQIIADNVQISNTYIVEALSHETIDIDINNDTRLRSLTPPPLPPPPLPPPPNSSSDRWSPSELVVQGLSAPQSTFGAQGLRPPLGVSDPVPDVENEVEEPSPNATVQQTSASGSPPPLPNSSGGFATFRVSSEEAESPLPKYTLCCNLCVYLTTFYCIIFVVLIITVLILFL
uniref:Uncharacterized protein n=1 Tax=viral metagenome TaxID=1070528 RepID=A0A6C0ICB3_9ZZZZ